MSITDMSIEVAQVIISEFRNSIMTLFPNDTPSDYFSYYIIQVYLRNLSYAY